MRVCMAEFYSWINSLAPAFSARSVNGAARIGSLLLVVAFAILPTNAPAAAGGNLGPQACIAQAGFMCADVVYNSIGISFTFGQTTSQNYYGNYMFIAGQGQDLNANGIPINMTTTNVIAIGLPNSTTGVDVLTPGQTVDVTFPARLYAASNIPPYTSSPVASGLTEGTPFAGYVWLGYCLTSSCPVPGTYFAKVAALGTRATGTPAPNAHYAGAAEQVSGLVVIVALIVLLGRRKPR